LLEPYLSAALAKGDTVLANIYSSIAPQFLIAAYYSTNDWKKSHPAVARAFAEAMAETARWANQNHAQSAQILERSTGIHIAPGQTRPIYAETLDPAMIQPVIDAAATDGVLTASFPAASLLGR
jgi:NitT/TauT family transport system substrate-binding protein